MCKTMCGLCRKQKDHYEIGDLVQVKAKNRYINGVVSKRYNDRIVFVRYIDRNDIEIKIIEKYLFYLNKTECPIVSSLTNKQRS